MNPTHATETELSTQITESTAEPTASSKCPVHHAGRTQASTQPIAFPTDRRSPLDPPEGYRELRAEQPVCPVSLTGGNTGWLLTRHEDVRALLADGRFSSDRSRAASPVQRFPLRRDDLPGMIINMDPPEHTRYRRMLTGYFTVRRMRALTERVERIVAEHLDAMRLAGPPADLVTTYALPIPSLVICELLGVPYADRGRFQGWTAALLSLHATEEESHAARKAIRGYMRELVEAKRRQPDDAIISTLIRKQDPDDPRGPLTDDELAGMGMLLLVAGHETTANMLALGTFTLLNHPDQLSALMAHPENADRAVEELLRYLTIIQYGLTRVAEQDAEIGGQHVAAGQTVVVALNSANRDAEHFTDPDRLDLTREPSQHVAFGHGIHQCLGQQLARVEMAVALPALFRAFPDLRLAVPAEQVPMRDDMFIYGVYELPLTWGR